MARKKTSVEIAEGLTKALGTIDMIRDLDTAQTPASVVRRAWPEEQRRYNVPPVMLMSLEEAGEALAASSFMQPWLISQYPRIIREALAKGAVFTMERDGEPMAEYKTVDRPELQDLQSAGVRETTVKKAVAAHIAAESPRPSPDARPGTPAVKKPAKESKVKESKPQARAGGIKNETLLFTFAKDDKAFDESLEDLPSQAQKILRIIRGAGRVEMNGSLLEATLEGGKVKAGLAADLPILARFRRFYNGGTLVKFVKGATNA